MTPPRPLPSAMSACTSVVRGRVSGGILALAPSLPVPSLISDVAVGQEVDPAQPRGPAGEPDIRVDLAVVRSSGVDGQRRARPDLHAGRGVGRLARPLRRHAVGLRPRMGRTGGLDEAVDLDRAGFHVHPVRTRILPLAVDEAGVADQKRAAGVQRDRSAVAAGGEAPGLHRAVEP